MVQRQHELAVERLMKRVLADQLVQYADLLAVAAQVEIGLDQHFLAFESDLLQPDGETVDDRSLPKFTERGSAPETECPLEREPGLLVSARSHVLPAFTDQPLEYLEVDVLALGPQHVPGCPGGDGLLRAGSVGQQFAQLGDVNVKGGGGAAGWVTAPDLGYQLLDRDHLIGADEEGGQHGSHLRRAQHQRPAVFDDA